MDYHHTGCVCSSAEQLGLIMSPPDTLDFWALEDFAQLNEYGLTDDSSISMDEAQLWEDFVFLLPSDRRRPPNHITTTDETDPFRKCEVTGQLGECIKFTAVWL